MQVSVFYFAMLREQRGRADESLHVEAGLTVGGLYEQIFAAGSIGAMSIMYAVNQSYVSADHKLAENDEVAFIPPLGGG
jgi:molybdopterin converting factor subunit 1